MPTVIGIDQVPREIVRPKWYSDLGYAQGALARAILVAMAGKGGGGGIGQVPTQPTPQNPGTFNFPPGSQSPIEAAQIRQMSGVPTQQGFLSRSTQMPSPGGVTYTQPTRLGIRPDLDYQTKQAQLQKAQQDLDPNSPMNQYIKSLAKPQTTLTPSHTQQIEADALDGDEDAIAAYRYLKKLGVL